MTTATQNTLTAQRPGFNAWLRMIQAEARMVARDTSGMITPLGLPLILMVMMSLASGDTSQEVGPGVTVLDYYLMTVVIVMVITVVAVLNMPSFLATYRKTKVLRRLAVTPASPAMVLVAQMIVSLLQVLVGVALALGAGMLFFDANLPNSILTAIVVLLVACLALYGVGMIVASVARTPNAATALGLVVFLGLAAFGGMFIPVENLPDTMQAISHWLPYAAAVEGLQSAWLGEAVDPQNRLVLGGTTVLGAAVAAMLFRWE